MICFYGFYLGGYSTRVSFHCLVKEISTGQKVNVMLMDCLHDSTLDPYKVISESIQKISLNDRNWDAQALTKAELPRWR